MEFGIAYYAGITVLCYLFGLWIKASNFADKWIPCAVGVLGIILGIVSYLLKVPDFPANDFINAAAVGVVSGLTATGIHQIGKQLAKDE